MKRKIYLLPFFFVVLAFVGCDETTEAGKYDNWRERNEAFIDSLANVYETATNRGGLGYYKDSRDQRQKIYYKIIETGDSTIPSPYLTSTVNVYYRGMLINEAVFGASTDKYYYKLYEQLDVFDTTTMSGLNPNPDFDAPGEFLISNTGLRNGWVEILQHMHPGDRWEVYIPYQCGYGTSDYGSIPGYSTLIFDMTLDSIKEY